MNAGLPLPREHGGYLTLAGAALAGVMLATAAAPAVGFALALCGGFFARGPFERSARWGKAEAVLLGLCSLAVLLGAWLATRAGSVFALAAGSAALAIVGGAWWARHVREHRAARFEIAAMAILGGAAGPIALAGGLPIRPALALAIVLGAHAALSVPLVRSELRPNERPLRGRAEARAAVALGAAFAALLVLGLPMAGLGLIPRALHLVRRRFGSLPRLRPAQVGLRETIALVTCAALSIYSLR